MEFSQCFLLAACLLLNTTVTTADFQDTSYYIKYIYHETHDLLLVLVEESQECYFSHVENNTKAALMNCHRGFLEQELYDVITWADPSKVQPTTLDTVRDRYGDILADFMCLDKKIFQLNVSFDVVQTCAGSMVGR